MGAWCSRGPSPDRLHVASTSTAPVSSGHKDDDWGHPRKYTWWQSCQRGTIVRQGLANFVASYFVLPTQSAGTQEGRHFRWCLTRRRSSCTLLVHTYSPRGIARAGFGPYTNGYVGNNTVVDCWERPRHLLTWSPHRPRRIVKQLFLLLPSIAGDRSIGTKFL